MTEHHLVLFYIFHLLYLPVDVISLLNRDEGSEITTQVSLDAYQESLNGSSFSLESPGDSLAPPMQVDSFDQRNKMLVYLPALFTKGNKKYPVSSLPYSTPFSDHGYECGGSVTLTTIPAVLHSPGRKAGRLHPPYSNCRWTLNSEIVDPDYPPVLRIRVVSLQIKDETDCTFNYLEILGHRKLCGNMFNEDVRLNVTNATLVFRSTNNIGNRGFTVKVSYEYQGCRPEIKVPINSQGYVMSPGYPESYSNGVDCWTQLFVTPSSTSQAAKNEASAATITLIFEFIDMEPDDQCAYDFVEVFDTVNASSKIELGKHYGRYCEYNSSYLETGVDGEIETIESTGPLLLIHFYSDHLLHGRGYRAKYIVSPRSSRPVQAPVPTSTPSTTLITFTRPSQTNSPPSPAPPTPGYPRPPPPPSPPPPPPPSPSPTSLVSPQSSSASASPVSTSSPSSGCQWYHNEVTRVLQSPGYPREYPANYDCTISLRSPLADDKVVIVFDKFFLEPHDNCAFDRVELYDPYANGARTNTSLGHHKSGHSRASLAFGDKAQITLSEMKPVRVYCGAKNSRLKYIGRGPKLFIRFYSNSHNQFAGFTAKYASLQQLIEIVIKSFMGGRKPTGSILSMSEVKELLNAKD